MQIGYKANFTANKDVLDLLSKWLGAYHFIRKAKIQENEYFYSFGKKFVPINLWQGSKENKNPEFVFIDQSYSHFKNKELTPWLFEVPSQLLRNSATNWFQTQWKYMRGECGAPRSKNKTESRSMLLTNDLFTAEKYGGVLKIAIGTRKFPIGEIRVNWRGKKIKSIPNSLTIKKDTWGKWTVSFSAEGNSGLVEDVKKLREEWRECLSELSKEKLKEKVLGIDRGIIIPVATTLRNFSLSETHKNNMVYHEYKRKKWQRKLARQIKGSKRRDKTKRKIAKTYESQTNIRVEFAHQATHYLVRKTNKSVFVLENLPVKQMTKSAKGTADETGKNVAQKSGLNEAILNVGWGRIETFLTYKAIREGKIVFKVQPNFTSQRCSICGHTDQANRQEQSLFSCIKCGHAENADINAARNIGDLAVNLLKDSGTELLKNGTLRSALSKVRSARKGQNDDPKDVTTRKKRSARQGVEAR